MVPLNVVIVSVLKIDDIHLTTGKDVWVGMSNPNLVSNCYDTSNTIRDTRCDNDVFYWVDGTPVSFPREPWKVYCILKYCIL